MTKCKKSCIVGFIDNILHIKKEFVCKYFTPFLLLGIRFLIAQIFFESGRSKLSNFDSTVYLFEYEYMVPLLNPIIGAYTTTFFEIACAALIMFGLGTRFATLPLIAITLVIQFLVLQNHDHFFWLAMLVTVLIYGPGYFSLDNVVRRQVENFKSNKKGK